MAHRPLPQLLSLLFALMMLTLCAFLAWWSLSQYELRFRVADVALSLDTSRQREAKQQYEYDQARQELPQTLADLAALTPEAEAMKAREQSLRAERKALRSEAEERQAAIASAQAEGERLSAQAQALALEVSALKSQAEELQARIALAEEALDAPQAQ